MAVIYFLRQLEQTLFSHPECVAVMHILKLAMSQLLLMQTFVDDLLDLRQMKEGVFRLVNSVFDPTDVIEQVCAVFRPQADAKGIQLSF